MPPSPAVAEHNAKAQGRVPARLTPARGAPLGVAADGIEVAAEAGSPEHERPDAKHDKDDRDHPRNSLHRLEGGSAVDIADSHHSYPDERQQGDSDCGHTLRGS